MQLGLLDFSNRCCSFELAPLAARTLSCVAGSTPHQLRSPNSEGCKDNLSTLGMGLEARDALTMQLLEPLCTAVNPSNPQIYNSEKTPYRILTLLVPRRKAIHIILHRHLFFKSAFVGRELRMVVYARGNAASRGDERQH